MKQKLHFFCFFTLSFKFFDRQNNLWSGRHKFTKEDKKNIIFQGCASSRGDEAQPSVWGRNQAHFCAINDFGCAPKHLVVLHRGEMKRNPEKMMFYVLW